VPDVPSWSSGGALELRWRQLRPLRAEFALEAGDALLATLRASSFGGSTGELDAGGQRLVLRASGFRVTASDADGRPVAELRRNWTGARGSIELPAGERVAWTRRGAWRQRVTLADQAGNRLAQLDARNGLARFEAGVLVDPAARSRPDLRTLLGVAWFTLVLMRNQAAVAG
jgi:hypothetical protein